MTEDKTLTFSDYLHPSSSPFDSGYFLRLMFARYLREEIPMESVADVHQLYKAFCYAFNMGVGYRQP